MATFFRFHCAECGQQAVNDDKTKWYVHAFERRGTKSNHKIPAITVVKETEKVA